MEYRIIRKDNIAHSGVKGQKWGVRRYQNEDGSLTQEGKERYSTGGKLHEMRMKSMDRSAARGKDLTERGKGSYPRAVVMGIVRSLAIDFTGITAARLGANVPAVNKGMYALHALNFGATVSQMRDIHNYRSSNKAKTEQKNES